MSYLIGYPGVAFVTDTSGKVSLAPGIPVFGTAPLSTAIAAGLVTDGDAVYAPTVTAIAPAQSVLPAVVVADDSVYAPAIAFGAQTLLPVLVVDGDGILTTNVGWPLSVDALVADGDAFFNHSIKGPVQFMSPALWVDATVVVAPSLSIGSITLSAALVNDSEGFAAGVNVGWKLFSPLVVDVELFPAPRAFPWAFIVPQVVKEDEMLVAYPFFIQSLTGGVPVAPRAGGLTGSIKQTARLTGSIEKPRLTGSLKPSPHLTGSLRGVRLTGSLRPGARRSGR